MKIKNIQTKNSDIVKTLVYQTPSATYHFTPGDKYLYLDFLDRNTTIKYKARSTRGKQELTRMLKYGFVKETLVK